MKLKEVIFGGGVKASGGFSQGYRGSIQEWLPIKNIIDGIVVTRDMRFIKILEIMPINFYLKPEAERRNIISAYAAFLKVAPASLQAQVITQKADMSTYTARMREYAANEESERCRAMIEDNIDEIGALGAGNAICHRFFLIFEYEPQMKARQNTVRAIAQRMAEEAEHTSGVIWICADWRYWSRATVTMRFGAAVRTCLQADQPPGKAARGVYDMATVVHGIYNTEDYHG